MSGQTPVPGLAERPSAQRAYMVHVLIRHPRLPSGQTTAKKYPRIRYQAEPAAGQHAFLDISSIICTTWYVTVSSCRRRLYTPGHRTVQPSPAALQPRKPQVLRFTTAPLEIPPVARGNQPP